MVTERNRYIRKSIIILFLMFLCLQGASCGSDRIVIQAEAPEEESVQNSSEDLSDILDGTESENKYCYIYVCGAVKFPGVYQMNREARIYEAVEKAGGFTSDAREAAINLALPIEDGQMIYVPGASDETDSNLFGEEKDDGLVNINTAGVDELTTLTGIGKVKAASIIDYRESDGAFQAIEDIMKVPGIGQGSFDRIKNQIKVK